MSSPNTWHLLGSVADVLVEETLDGDRDAFERPQRRDVITDVPGNNADMNPRLILRYVPESLREVGFDVDTAGAVVEVGVRQGCRQLPGPQVGLVSEGHDQCRSGLGGR